jgi:hypothetical protein
MTTVNDTSDDDDDGDDKERSKPHLSNVGGHTPTSRKNVVRIVEERSSER